MSETITTIPAPISYHEMIDLCEVEIAKLPPVELPVKYSFRVIDGVRMCVRTIFMPAGTIVTSKEHRYRHNYFISEGSCLVGTQQEGMMLLIAPFYGVTEPGTRRLIRVLTNCLWTTYHPTDKTTIEEVEQEILVPHENHLLHDAVKNRLITASGMTRGLIERTHS